MILTSLLLEAQLELKNWRKSLSFEKLKSSLLLVSLDWFLERSWLKYWESVLKSSPSSGVRKTEGSGSSGQDFLHSLSSPVWLGAMSCERVKESSLLSRVSLLRGESRSSRSLLVVEKASSLTLVTTPLQQEKWKRFSVNYCEDCLVW